MLVICAECNHRYDDYDHWTFFPHDRFELSQDVKDMIAAGQLRESSGSEGDPKLVT